MNIEILSWLQKHLQLIIRNALSVPNRNVTAWFGIMLSLVGCSEDIRLSPAPEASSQLSAESLFCALPPLEIGKYTNVLFVIDQSGSNRYGQNSGDLGTDPDKERRKGALQKFLEHHRSNTYIKWGFIAFNGDFGARSYINRADGGYFGTAAEMDQALVTFSGTQDNNGTPYEEALNLTRSAIEKEIVLDAQAETANFAVIFISDGRPVPSIEPEERLFEMVQNLTLLADGEVHVSTVYYNTSAPDVQDRARLEEMARVGKGKFQDASQDQTSINIEDLIVGGVYYEPYVLSDLFVYNLNAGTCDDGRIGVDSDADGLCDRDEEHYNREYVVQLDADPSTRGRRFLVDHRNSFLENYSDFFFLRKLRGERLPDCTLSRNEAAFDLLNACEKKFLVSPTPQGPTEKWTQEMYNNGKKAFADYVDSDGDHLLDGLEVFFFKDKGAPLNFHSAKDKTNGIENRELLRNHQHPLRPEQSVAYNPKLTFVQRNADGHLCYEYSQRSMELYKTKTLTADRASRWFHLAHGPEENVFLVYYVMKNEYSPHDRGAFKYSYQRFRFGEPGARIDLNKQRFDLFLSKPNRGQQ